MATEVGTQHQACYSVSKFVIEPTFREDIPGLQIHPSELVRAARALAEENIPIVEYGDQVRYRFGYPTVLALVEWAIPDLQLSLASQILLGKGFSRIFLSNKTEGGAYPWETWATIHRLDIDGRQRIHLYPLSLIGLTTNDTAEVQSTFDHEIRVLSPKPAAYMLSLIKFLLRNPLGTSSRRRVCTDLVSFISYYIFHESPTSGIEGDYESEEEFQKRAEDAIVYVKSWDWGTTEPKYLDIVEDILRDCGTLRWLTETA
ncbi:hypothetical protein BBP40_003057 [Aspergillus hancockii]|nr:hypothetical protein BBP40_003057 [Aspergillus hancockii]